MNGNTIAHPEPVEGSHAQKYDPVVWNRNIQEEHPW